MPETEPEATLQERYERVMELCDRFRFPDPPLCPHGDWFVRGMACPHCWQESGRKAERARLTALAHAIGREMGILIASNFERLANMVIEHGPMAFKTKQQDGVTTFTATENIRIKDVRDDA